MNVEILGSFNVQVISEKEYPALPGSSYFIKVDAVSHGMAPESERSKPQKKLPTSVGENNIKWGDSFHFWVKKLPFTVVVQLWEFRSIGDNVFLGQTSLKLTDNSQVKDFYSLCDITGSNILPGKLEISYTMVLKPKPDIPYQSYFTKYSLLSLSPVIYSTFTCVEIQGEISDLAMLAISEKLAFTQPPTKVSDRGFRICWQVRPLRETIGSQRKSTLRIQNVMLQLLDALYFFGFNLLRGDCLRTITQGKHAIQEFNKILYLVKDNQNTIEDGQGPRYFFIQSLHQKGFGWSALLQGNINKEEIEKISTVKDKSFPHNEVLDKNGAHLCWQLKIANQVTFFNHLNKNNIVHKTVYGHNQIFWTPPAGVSIVPTDYLLVDMAHFDTRSVIMRGNIDPTQFASVGPVPKLLECQTDGNLFVWNLAPLMEKLRVKYIKDKQYRYYAVRMLNKLYELGWNFHSLHELNAMIFVNSEKLEVERVPSSDFLLVTADYFQGFKVEIVGEVSIEIMKKIESLGFQRLERLSGPENFSYAFYLKIPGGLGIEKKLTAKALKRKQKQLQNRTLMVTDALRNEGWDVKSSWGGTGKPSTFVLQREKKLVTGNYVLVDVTYYGKHPAIEVQGHHEIVNQDSVTWLTKDTGLFAPSKIPDPKDGSLLCWATVLPIKHQALTIKGQRKQQNKFRRIYLRFMQRVFRLGWEYRFPYRGAMLFFVPYSLKDHWKVLEDEDVLAKAKLSASPVTPTVSSPTTTTTTTTTATSDQKTEPPSVTLTPSQTTETSVSTTLSPHAIASMDSDFTSVNFLDDDDDDTEMDPLALLQAAEDLSTDIKNFSSALSIKDDLSVTNPNDDLVDERGTGEEDDELNMDWCKETQ
eukprot:TRINITY_DN2577_c0_g1_i1.p1 TRINITY_DN2577_c0_g1~~TRINITY_DN2577_c0_g1_i1.p1  ORF type:complete len:868 (+),score=187.20 TRINITY_DN2577_c0_g1_i1:120-2723(+)